MLDPVTKVFLSQSLYKHTQTSLFYRILAMLFDNINLYIFLKWPKIKSTTIRTAQPHRAWSITFAELVVQLHQGCQQGIRTQSAWNAFCKQSFKSEFVISDRIICSYSLLQLFENILSFHGNSWNHGIVWDVMPSNATWSNSPLMNIDIYI